MPIGKYDNGGETLWWPGKHLHSLRSRPQQTRESIVSLALTDADPLELDLIIAQIGGNVYNEASARLYAKTIHALVHSNGQLSIESVPLMAVAS